MPAMAYVTAPGSDAVVVRSLLYADRETVWSWVTTPSGINDELRPLARMTAPRHVRAAGIGGVVLGERLCRSWVLLLGVLPVDYDDITVDQLEPPHRFFERSSMLSQRRWEHERTLEPASSGCVLTDCVSFDTRALVPDRVVLQVVPRIFRHRHGRLRRRYGGRALDVSGITP